MSQCKECRKITRSDRTTRECVRRGRLKARYGITLEQWMKLFELQDGVCAICKQPETKAQSLSVDHCHKTGKIRALLCNSCNKGLGFFKDNSRLLKIAAEYVA